MGRLFIAVALASVLVLETASPGRAQWSSSSSSRSGMFGSQSAGSGSSFSNAGMTRSASSGTASMFGGSGRSQQSSTSGRAQQSSLGSSIPATLRSFGNFVGTDRQDIQSSGGRTSAGTNAGSSRGRTGASRTGRQSNAQGANRGNRGNSGAGQGGSSATEVRTTLQLGFEPLRPTASRVATTLMDRLARSTRIHVVGPVTVDVRDDTTILRGEVATSHDRMLAEQLALLEPGVRRVKNELVVTGESVKGESTTPPATSPPAAEHSTNPPAANPPVANPPAPGE